MINRRSAMVMIGAVIAGGSSANADFSHDAGITEEYVDRMELNIKYDCNGNAEFAQIILWQWDVSRSAYLCCGWEIVPMNKSEVTEKDGRKRCVLKHPSERIPVMKTPSGLYRMIITTRRGVRQIFATHFEESHTQFDPEVEDRKNLPKENRTPPIQSSRFVDPPK